jgi:transcription factor IIIB subunit 2
LQLDKIMPEHDPALYNIAFARKLEFGSDQATVAEDASRLVRRFKADWMTQGRRPSGICGACLIIAARMSNYLRTVEEVAQVVKCSPYTIRRRLKEFALTQMAKKSVREWRELGEAELSAPGETEPPVVRQQREKRELEALKAAEKAEAEALEAAAAEENEEEEGPAAKRRKSPGKGANKGKGKAKGAVGARTRSGDVPLDEDEALAAAAADADLGEEDGEGDGQGGEGDDEAMEPLQANVVADALDAAGDNPAAAQEERKRKRLDFSRELKHIKAVHAGAAEAQEQEERAAAAAGDGDGEGAEKEEGLRDGDGDGDGDGIGKEEGLSQPVASGSSAPAATQLVSINDLPADHPALAESKAAGKGKGKGKGRSRPEHIVEFTQWDDRAATIAHFSQAYFTNDATLAGLRPEHVEERVQKWLGLGNGGGGAGGRRDPLEVARECWAVDAARARAAREARDTYVRELGLTPEEEEELDRQWVMEEDEAFRRGTVWVAKNQRWVEKEKGEYRGVGGGTGMGRWWRWRWRWRWEWSTSASASTS